MNAFGTHHLHLTPKRSQELLYVIFSRNDAFLVMLGDNDSFDDGTLAQAISEARAGTVHELRGILGAASPRTMQRQKPAPTVRVLNGLPGWWSDTGDLGGPLHLLGWLCCCTPGMLIT